jgi:AcrR family transcriptional regulator
MRRAGGGGTSARVRILAALDAELALEGTSPVTLDAVVKRAHASKSTVYKLWPSFVDLLDEWLRGRLPMAAGSVDMWAVLKGIPDRAWFDDRIRRLAVVWVVHCEHDGYPSRLSRTLTMLRSTRATDADVATLSGQLEAATP